MAGCMEIEFASIPAQNEMKLTLATDEPLTHISQTDEPINKYSTCIEMGVEPPEKGHEIVEKDQEPITNFGWASVTCFQYAYSFINTGMGLFVLPMEAQLLNSSSASMWVGAYLAVCGLAQLTCPIAGKLSDRHRSRFGRRRPFMIAGTVVAVISFQLLRVASTHRWAWAYFFALFPAQLGLNVAYSAQCGLPADLQQKRGDVDNDKGNHEKGVASGFVALHTFLGALSAVLSLVLTRDSPVQIMYWIYILSLIFVVLLACSVVSEESTANHTRDSGTPFSFEEVLRSFALDLEDDSDFFWVCAGRMCYYFATSVVVFLYYYIRDMYGIEEETTLRFRLGTVMVAGQLVGALSSVPSSRLSNVVGRKPVIYLACAAMVCTYLLFIIAPIWEAWPVVIFAGLLFGLGNGAYLSVDYALALDCLPKHKSAAESFGLWGVAGFVGSTVGPLFGGWLLDTTRTNRNVTAAGKAEEYSYLGYILVMLNVGIAMNSFVVATVVKIRRL